MSSQEKTNVIRILESLKVPFSTHYYGDTGAVSAVEVAAVLGQDPDCVFKTLVTTGAAGGHFVFIIPARETLDLKKAAKACGEKSIVMLKSKDLLPLTGYIHGGCSPIGMKKLFPTYMDETALLQETVFISAGKIGYQVSLSPDTLAGIVPIVFSDLTVTA